MRIFLFRMVLAAAVCLPVAQAQQEEAPRPNLLEALGKWLQPRQDAPAAAPPPVAADAPAAQAAAPVPAGPQHRIALVIGNAAYSQGALANPVNDARAMAGRLRGLGFEVLLRENLRVRDIGGVYREFRSRITPGGVALVFYAGHGVQFKGQNYFPAVDSEIATEEDVPLQSLNLGTLLDNMDEAKAGVSLVFLDACRDNPFARHFRSGTRGLAKVEAASGTLIHYATRPGSVAEDGEGQNGTYTEALLAQLGEAGVPVEQVLKRVTNRVVARTKGKQEPWVEGSLRGDFYFVFQGPATVTVPMAPDDADAEAWDAAERADTAAAYGTYLGAYPDGRYSVAAKIRLDALQKPVVTAAAPRAAEDPETLFWREVTASGAPEYLDAYLKQYPKGRYAALARLELKKLDERDRAARAREEAERAAATAAAERQAWDRARSENTPAAFDRYLDDYPRGQFAALAAAAKQRLKREAADRDKQEATQREAAAREAAERARRQARTELAALVRAQIRLFELPTTTPQSTSSGMPLLYAHCASALRGKITDGQLEELLAIYRQEAEGGDPIAQISLGIMAREGFGLPRDATQALRWFRQAADRGSAAGQLVYGANLMLGLGQEKNATEGVQWLRKAAAQGHPGAMASLGEAFLHGAGVAQDTAEGVSWIRKAADQGYSPAMVGLGRAYQLGEGLPKDAAQAIKWYAQAAEKGHPLGMTALAYAYQTGTGISRDAAAAVRWYRRAADLGEAEAMTRLGVMYASGMGVPQDHGQAAQWYRQAAGHDHVVGMYNLGHASRHGEGMARDGTQALAWYGKAAERGHAMAMVELGNMYREGDAVAADPARAVEWYRKAADLGETTAMNNLGFMYHQGAGVAQDYAEAARWYRRAAELGEAMAMNNLGAMYQSGKGVPTDLQEALKWYREALKHGITAARDNLKRLGEN